MHLWTFVAKSDGTMTSTSTELKPAPGHARFVALTSKSCLKNRAASMFTPMAANTMAKLSLWSSITDLVGSLTRPPCLQIWAAIWGRWERGGIYCLTRPPCLQIWAAIWGNDGSVMESTAIWGGRACGGIHCDLAGGLAWWSLLRSGGRTGA